MSLSPNEIKNRAFAFVREWQGETSEKAEAKSFWDAFFYVFGISRRRVASFEVPTKKTDGKQGYIDLFWKGKLIVEHKSKGKSLDRAHSQAKDYFGGLKEEELPQYILVSDFELLQPLQIWIEPIIPARRKIAKIPPAFPLSSLKKLEPELPSDNNLLATKPAFVAAAEDSTISLLHSFVIYFSFY